MRWNGGVAVAYGDTRLILDPRRSHPAYPEVFITHAHHDHSRGLRLQRGTKYSTIQTLDLATGGRRGVVQRWREVVVNRRFRVGELEVEAHNAGHILGSVQYEIRSPEGSIVYTGDINVVDTFTTRAADIVPCDVLIIEATYGSPCRFPPRDRVIAEILQWVVKSITKDGRIPALQTDPIGNAQELIAILNRFSRVPVVTHPRITAINQIYERFGCRLNYIDARTEDAEELASSRSCVYITPKRVDLSGHPEFNVAYVSGWAPKFAGWRKPFTLSDHADFYGLLEYIQNVQPRMVYTCLGGRRMNQILARSVRKLLGCLLYTSDAADDGESVDLGGRRII